MSFVAAKCTQCGANIKVDDTKDAGICEFCGTAYVTEKAINNYNTFITNNYAGAHINIVKGDVDNLVKLGNKALEYNSAQEAYDYANRALEVNVEYADAWLLKMHAVTHFENPRFDELLSCGKNAIEYSNKESRESVSYSVWSNFLKLGNKALEHNNAQEAYGYAKIALEINLESTDAWLLKMRAISHFENPRFDELLSCGKNAIEYSDKESRESVSYSVWSFVANFSVSLMDAIMKEHCGPRGKNELNSINHLTLTKNPEALENRPLANLANNVVNFCASIPKDCAEKHDDIQDLIVKFTFGYLKYFELDMSEIGQNHRIPKEYVDKMMGRLRSLRSCLPDEKQAIVDDMKIPKPKSGRCYIATAVYGSYDCPAVWTLRRFRDLYLAQYKVGRIFIKSYYAVSPYIVKLFGKNSIFISLCRIPLEILVKLLNKNGYESTPYIDNH